MDRKSSCHLKIDIINVSIKFFDKNLELLDTATIQFENNVIKKFSVDALISISPREFEVNTDLQRAKYAEKSLMN